MAPTPQRAVEIAGAVLAKASALDHRTPQPDEFVVEAWAEAFAGQRVWLREALAAVTDFYREPQRDRLMPGDVLARTRVLTPEPDSSDEMVEDHIDQAIAHPFAPTTLALGVPTHEFDSGTEAEQIADWVRTHRGEVAARIRDGALNLPALTA